MLTVYNHVYVKSCLIHQSNMIVRNFLTLRIQIAIFTEITEYKILRTIFKQYALSCIINFFDQLYFLSLQFILFYVMLIYITCNIIPSPFIRTTISNHWASFHARYFFKKICEVYTVVDVNCPKSD